MVRHLKIVSFGMMLPAVGGGSAGADFYANHVRALRELGHEVRVVVPPLAPGGPAVRDSVATETLVMQQPYQYSGRLVRWLNNMLPAAVRAAYRREVRGNSVLHAWLRSADVVEYQWAEFASLARTANRMRGGRGPSCLVLHDEIVQRELRRFRAARGLRLILRGLAVAFAFLQERKHLGSIQKILVLSEKDAERCKRVAPRCSPYIVHPPVVDDSGAVSARPMGDVILFVGAMSRPENVHAVSWFHELVWPSILSRMPTLRFVIAGANPTTEILDLAGPGVEVTGFIPDLEATYARAGVVVVPIFFGAGVKFKTLIALAHGIPVVSTPAGGEGIFEGESGIFAAIEDDPQRFAAAVVAAFEDPSDRAERVRAAERVRQSYGVRSYADRVRDFYAEVVPSPKADSGTP